MTQPPQDATPAGPSDGPPPGAPTGAGGTLVVDVDLYKGHRRAKANIYLDGIRMVNQKGPNAYRVAAGPHMVSAEVNVMGRTLGQADLQVQVAPGQTTTLFYSSPASIDRPGALGFQPAEHPGARSVRAVRSWAIAIMVVLLLFVIVLTVALFGGRTSGRPEPTGAPVTTSSSQGPPGA